MRGSQQTANTSQALHQVSLYPVRDGQAVDGRQSWHAPLHLLPQVAKHALVTIALPSDEAQIHLTPDRAARRLAQGAPVLADAADVAHPAHVCQGRFNAFLLRTCGLIQHSY